MIVILTLLTAVAVLVLVGVLVVFLVRIIHALERIGGEPTGYTYRTSLLAKIAFGVRAIEQETGHIAPEVTRLNEGLGVAAGALGSIDGHLQATIEAVVQQEKG